MRMQECERIFATRGCFALPRTCVSQCAFNADVNTRQTNTRVWFATITSRTRRFAQQVKYAQHRICRCREYLNHARSLATIAYCYAKRTGLFIRPTNRFHRVHLCDSPCASSTLKAHSCISNRQPAECSQLALQNKLYCGSMISLDSRESTHRGDVTTNATEFD